MKTNTVRKVSAGILQLSIHTFFTTPSCQYSYKDIRAYCLSQTARSVKKRERSYHRPLILRSDPHHQHSADVLTRRKQSFKVTQAGQTYNVGPRQFRIIYVSTQRAFKCFISKSRHFIKHLFNVVLFHQSFRKLAYPLNIFIKTFEKIIEI